MSGYVLPGALGLLTGLLLHWSGFSRQEGLRRGLGLRRSIPLLSGLTAVGWAMAVTALLCWLAVIDVDSIAVLPLSFGALAGGAVLGIAAGLCGCTPSTAFAGLGAGNAAQALCVLMGCAAMSLFLPRLEGVLSPLRQAEPYCAAMLFNVTLDKPYLLDGGFLGQGAVGLVAVAAAMAVTVRRMNDESGMRNLDGGTEAVADAADAPSEEELAPPEPAASPDVPDISDARESDIPDAADVPGTSTPTDPEAAAGDTFIALLPGEEPLIIDTDTASPDTPEASGDSDTPDSKPTDQIHHS